MTFNELLETFAKKGYIYFKVPNFCIVHGSYRDFQMSTSITDFVPFDIELPKHIISGRFCFTYGTYLSSKSPDDVYHPLDNEDIYDFIERSTNGIL